MPLLCEVLVVILTSFPDIANMSEFWIDQNSIANAFLQHLVISDNKRIFFSAPFGAGKSTFLQDFFESQKGHYISLSLIPVNYSVAANEDVFELIKYDLLLELLTKYKEEIEISQEDFGIIFSTQYFISDRMKFRNIVSSVIGLAEKLGKPAFGFLKALDDKVKDIEIFNKQAEQGEKIQLQNYLKSFENRKGVGYEMDEISLLIFNLIERLVSKKNSDESKFESALVIDDLDRLDPEHIFRLFNIFSSHYDPVSDKNKFGFDKVIFVCDIENIRKIYLHKYGQNVDFSGYIDKFYSKEIFEFDNTSFIKESIGKLIGGYLSDPKLTHERHRLLKRNTFYDIFCWMVFALLDAKEMNLRVLIQKETIRTPNYEFYLSNSYSCHHSRNFDFLVLMFYLKSFFGSYNVLDVKLKRLSDVFSIGFNPLLQRDSSSYDQVNVERAVMHMILPFLLPEDVAFSTEFKEINNGVFFLSEFEVALHYNTQRTDYSRVYLPYISKITRDSSSDSPEVKVNIFKLLYFAFVKTCQSGILR